MEDKDFRNLALTESELFDDEYDNCQFIDCSFVPDLLNRKKFIDCSFVNCDLSLSSLNLTAFRDVHFKGCKMLGMRFDHCQDFLFLARFENCILDMSSFYGMKLLNMEFVKCSLKDINFTKADLSNAIFEKCNLVSSQFEQTKLFKTDFSTSFNYELDPEENMVKYAKFSSDGLYGLLKKYEIKVM